MVMQHALHNSLLSQAVLEQTAIAAAKAKQREGDRLGEVQPGVERRRRNSDGSVHSATER